MNYLYFLFSELVAGILPVFRFFSPRLRHFLEGRKQLFARLQDFRKKNPEPVVWVHVASLGEYEQARPVISSLKTSLPDFKIAVSFFSPSGFDHVIKKPQPDVDFMTYLPLDTKSQAAKFVGLLNPELAIFVKYDLWHYHVQALHRRSIPIYLIAASFRKNQIYFSRYGGFFRKILSKIDWIFTQNQESVRLLGEIGIRPASLAGDTRFDRVVATAAAPRSLEDIQTWISGDPTFVVGSAWEEDMKLLIPLINARSGYRWIIAPHDLNPETMDDWAKRIQIPSKKYSRWQQGDSNQVLFIDNIGMLSSLYQFARIAYVGGAFGKGLHNILEPLGFGVPVIFGKIKKESKFPEASQAQQEGCGFSVSDEIQLETVFSELEKEDLYKKAANSARNWVHSNLGAADRIVSFITSRRPNGKVSEPDCQ
jgi:3-deoxy-D-manno-octulosonic-acid transferase